MIFIVFCLLDAEKGIPSQNPAGLFVEHLLMNFENAFNVSFKLTAICDYLKSKSEIKNEFFLFYSKLFGILKFEMISNDINFFDLKTTKKKNKLHMLIQRSLFIFK